MAALQDSNTKYMDHISLFQPIHIALLKLEQWSYIQKRYRMSPRELQVAKLVCQGFSNEEIAKDLKIKGGTVKTHIRNIYRKIRVRSKIRMLLKFVDDATKFSAKSGATSAIPLGATSAIPIVEIKESDKKSHTTSNIPKKV